MTNSPLSGDPRRRASATLRGFAYQLWHTVDAWLALEAGQILYAEGVEDFDVVGQTHATPVQIKDDAGSGRLTLGTGKALAALRNFWTARRKNRGTPIHYKYLTTAELGHEREIGKDQKPLLSVWRRCHDHPDGDDALANAKRIREYLLLHASDLGAELGQALREFDDRRTLEELILPFEWLTDSPGLERVRAKVIDRIRQAGEPLGLPPEECDQVAHKLLDEVSAEAMAKHQGGLDNEKWRSILSQAAYVLIPRRMYNSMAQALAARLPQRVDGRPVLSRIDVAFVPPIVSSTLWDRPHVIDAIYDRIDQFGGCTVLGATGTGKTTLIRDALDRRSLEVLWIACRRVSTDDLLGIVTEASNEIHTPSKGQALVFDDFNLNDDWRPLEPCFRDLALAIREAQGSLVFASYTPLPRSLLDAACLDKNAELVMPNFGIAEIEKLLRWRGCLDEQRAAVLARFIYRRTNGHPQLVLAYAEDLVARHFSLPTDLHRHPPTAEDARQTARTLLRSTVSQPVRDFIYRLSTTSISLSRNELIILADLPPPLDKPGELIDEASGAWVEQFPRNYFTISPLLEGAAEEILPERSCQALHEAVARILLRRPSITFGDVGVLCFHALNGRLDDVLLFTTLYWFLASAEDQRRMALAMMLWMPNWAVESPQALGIEGASARRLFRLMQWQVALRTGIGELNALARVLSHEFALEEVEPEERQIYLRARLFEPDAPLGVAEGVSYLIEFAASNTNAPTASELEDNLHEYTRILEPRLHGRAAMTEFINVLEAQSDNVRRAILDGIGSEEVLHYLLLGAALDGATQSTFPTEAQVFLDTAIAAGRAWGHQAFLRAAEAERALCSGDDTESRAAAANQLDGVLSELGPSPSALEVRARIAFSMDDFGKTLEILREVLPNWRPPQPARKRATLAAQNAALAAGKLRIWFEAHAFFLDGKARAMELGAEVWALGFTADAGYAAWRAGNGSEALNHFGEVIAALEPRPLSAEDRYIRRAIGHLLFSGRGFDLPEEDQSLGICSRVDVGDEEPVVPPDLLWFAMYFLSLKVGDDAWHRRAEEVCRNSRFAVLRSQVHWNDAARAAEQGPYAVVLERVLDHARDRMIIEARVGLHLFDEDPRPEEGPVSEELVVAEIEPALVGSLLSMSVNNISMDEVFSAWRLTGASAGPGVSEAVAIATELASAPRATLFSRLFEAPNSEFERACAAALLSTDLTEDPAIALRSHALLLLYLSSVDFGIAGLARAEKAIGRYWRQATMTPSRLHNPKITVPELETALSGSLSALLLAANDAVTHPLPRQLLAGLVALDSWQSQEVPQAEC